MLCLQNTAAATRKVIDEMRIHWLLLLTGSFPSPSAAHAPPLARARVECTAPPAWGSRILRPGHPKQARSTISWVLAIARALDAGLTWGRGPLMAR